MEYTFEQKVKIWKDLIKWARKEGHFGSAKELGKSLGYAYDEWASKAIYQNRRKQVEFPVVLWRYILIFHHYMGFPLTDFGENGEKKPVEYEQKGSSWVID